MGLLHAEDAEVIRLEEDVDLERVSMNDLGCLGLMSVATVVFVP
jgi:hypothetical protein